MSSQRPNELIASPAFALDYARIYRSFVADPERYGYLYLGVRQELTELAAGTSNGYHAMGYARGKGDLRDSVTCYLQSDRHQKPDYRLVFREMPPAGPGGPPRRELIAVRPRRGLGNVYQHVLARLHRLPAELQPGLGVFGMRGPGHGGNEQSRYAELAEKRAIALAYAGQVPLAVSRPFDPAPVRLPAARRPQSGRDLGR